MVLSVSVISFSSTSSFLYKSDCYLESKGKLPMHINKHPPPSNLCKCRWFSRSLSCISRLLRFSTPNLSVSVFPQNCIIQLFLMGERKILTFLFIKKHVTNVDTFLLFKFFHAVNLRFFDHHLNACLSDPSIPVWALHVNYIFTKDVALVSLSLL